jgi:hypothetical protein
MRSLRRIVVAVVLTLVLGYLAIQAVGLASIQLRLWRNQPSADRIQTFLANQLPGVELRAAASYQRDLISVFTFEPISDTDRARLQSLLEEFKDREQLSVGVLLTTPSSSGRPPIESSI